jgi:hypothetical protein
MATQLLRSVALALVLAASSRGFTFTPSERVLKCTANCNNAVDLLLPRLRRCERSTLRRDYGKECTHSRAICRPRTEFGMMVPRLDDAGSYYRDELKQRIEEVRRDIIKEQKHKPPNPNLGAVDFIVGVMEALRAVDEPLPDFGCIVLLRSSTPRWKREILRSIAAPTWADEAQVASVLNQALGRRRNQFGILVGGAEGEEGEEYKIQFPSEAVEDLDEGKCWVECRLRDPGNEKLLAVIGWDLKKRKQDGAWLIDRLDWQDFRDEYRPGYGREEWTRVCG